MSRRLLLLEEGGGPEPVASDLLYGFGILSTDVPVASGTERNITFTDIGWVTGSSTQNNLAISYNQITGLPSTANKEIVLVTKLDCSIAYTTALGSTKRATSTHTTSLRATNSFPSNTARFVDGNIDYNTSITPYYNMGVTEYAWSTSGNYHAGMYSVHSMSSSGMNTYPLKLNCYNMTVSGSTATFKYVVALGTNDSYMGASEVANVDGASSTITIKNFVYLFDKTASRYKFPGCYYI